MSALGLPATQEAMNKGFEQRGARLGNSLLARDGLRQWTRQQAGLCQELRDAYERVFMLASERQYDRLAEEVGWTEALVDELKGGAWTLAPALTTANSGSELGSGSTVVAAERERSVTELLRARERALEALGKAAETARSTLARLGRSRQALAGYRISRSAAPRFQSCRV